MKTKHELESDISEAEAKIALYQRVKLRCLEIEDETVRTMACSEIENREGVWFTTKSSAQRDLALIELDRIITEEEA